MRSLAKVKVGDWLAVAHLENVHEIEGLARYTRGLIGRVHRVYRKPVNRGEPTVELDFGHGERFVYLAREVRQVGAPSEA